jgi:molybdenum cofactor cytidylyltransferase
MARLGAVLLAAGASARFAGGNKLLADLGGRPLIAHAADTLVASPLDEIVVVTGRDSEEVKRLLASHAVRFAHNEAWAAGMGSSISSGIRALGAAVAGAFIVPGDMPFLTAGLLALLEDRFDRAGGERIVVPTTPAGAQRNPVLWPRRYFPELARLGGAEGGKALLRRRAGETERVAIAEARVLEDIDTAEDLAAARRQLALRAR